MKTTQREFVVGLDLGSTMIRVAIGKLFRDGIEIIGVGQSPSKGMRKGSVINVESSSVAIRNAVKEAELMAGCKVTNVVVGVADRTILSQVSHVEVKLKHGSVKEQDLRKVIELAEFPPILWTVRKAATTEHGGLSWYQGENDLRANSRSKRSSWSPMVTIV